MIEIEVTEEHDVPGYATPVYTFICSMCDVIPTRDLDRVFVRDEAWRHTVSQHRVMPSYISVVFVDKNALEGLEKVDVPDSAHGV